MVLEWVSIRAWDWESWPGWSHFDPVNSIEKIKSCPLGGILIHRDDSWTVLAIGFDPETGNWLGVHPIPSKCIISMSVLASEEI